MGRPICGLVGDKILTGGGNFAKILSLSNTPETIKKVKYLKVRLCHIDGNGFVSLILVDRSHWFV